MHISSVDFVREEQGIKLNVNLFFSTLGWTDVSLSVVEYITEPIDGIQDVILNGTPPEFLAATSVLSYCLSAEFAESDWFQGVRVLSRGVDSPITLRIPVRDRELIGKDLLNVEAARIQGDKLIVDVTYSGGCHTHGFQLNWDGVIKKSNPPQIDLTLSHNANGDTCKAIMKETMLFDLSVILEDSPGSYVVRIKSPTGEIVADTP